MHNISFYFLRSPPPLARKKMASCSLDNFDQVNWHEEGIEWIIINTLLFFFFFCVGPVMWLDKALNMQTLTWPHIV